MAVYTIWTALYGTCNPYVGVSCMPVWWEILLMYTGTCCAFLGLENKNSTICFLVILLAVWNNSVVIARVIIISSSSSTIVINFFHPFSILIYSSITTTTCYGLEGPWIILWWGWGFPQRSRPTIRPTHPAVQWVPGLFPAVKRPGFGFDHTPRSSAEVKSEK